MKAKHRNRKHPSLSPKTALPQTATPKRKRWLWRGLILFVVAGAVVAAAWYMAGLRHDFGKPVARAEPAPNLRPSTNASEARQATRAVNNNQAFIAKVNHGNELIKQGKSEEAIKQYEEALRIFPDYVEAHNNLGNVLMRIGRVEEAISHFETAVK